MPVVLLNGADGPATLIIMNRPPPYFPQNQLSPPDEKRYKKFKIFIGLSIVVLLLILAGIGYGVYYLIRLLTV